MHRSVVLLTCFFVALVANPNLGCGSDGDSSSDYTYGEGEMEAAVVGTYSGTVNADGAAETVTVTIARVPAPGSVAAGLTPLCGTRTFFVKPAGACITASKMAIKATVVSSGPVVKSGELTGDFTAYHTLTGELDLSAGSARLSAMYQDGRFGAWTYYWSGDNSGSIGLDLSRK